MKILELNWKIFVWWSGVLEDVIFSFDNYLEIIKILKEEEIMKDMILDFEVLSFYKELEDIVDGE